MKRYFKHIIILAIGLLCFQASAQVELKSKIVDFLTYAPVENANIYLENSTIGTVSNTDGNFVLLVPQSHISDTLVISSIGYKSFRSAVSDFDETPLKNPGL